MESQLNQQRPVLLLHSAALLWTSLVWWECSPAPAVQMWLHTATLDTTKHCCATPAGWLCCPLLTADRLTGTCQTGLRGNKDQLYFIGYFLCFQVEVNHVDSNPTSGHSSRSAEDTVRTSPPPSLCSTVLSPYSLFSQSKINIIPHCNTTKIFYNLIQCSLNLLTSIITLIGASSERSIQHLQTIRNQLVSEQGTC